MPNRQRKLKPGFEDVDFSKVPQIIEVLGGHEFQIGFSTTKCSGEKNPQQWCIFDQDDPEQNCHFCNQ